MHNCLGFFEIVWKKSRITWSCPWTHKNWSSSCQTTYISPCLYHWWCTQIVWMLYNYSPNVICLSWCCNVDFHETDNVAWKCEYLHMTDMHALCHRTSQYHGFVDFEETVVMNMKMSLRKRSINWGCICSSNQCICTQVHLSMFGLAKPKWYLWCNTFGFDACFPTWNHTICN